MTAYYNEIDRKAAAWLRELMTEGVIPQGEVDERDIRDIEPRELDGFTQCHFFAGIGGWAYALRLAGWPDDRPVWTGSCPCQPFSLAGKGEGIADERHLWPAFRWLIAQRRPSKVFGEQVAQGVAKEWLAGVRDDVEAMGYRFGGAALPACSVGADHIRMRAWWAADGDGGQRGSRHPESNAGTDGRNNATRRDAVDWSRSIWWPCRDGKIRRVPARWMGYGQSERCGEAGGGGGRPAKRPSDAGYAGRISDAESERPQPQQDARHANGKREVVVSTRGGIESSVHGAGQHAPAGHGGMEAESEILSPSDDVSQGMAQGVGEGIWEVDWETFPLAPPEIGRVGALKGAGNAIVPELAAEFIRAAEEIGK